MRLEPHDEIQIDGIHPRNPITDAVIPDYLQVFAVTHAQEGTALDPAVLHPRCEEHEPIDMSRIRVINMRRIW